MKWILKLILVNIHQFGIKAREGFWYIKEGYRTKGGKACRITCGKEYGKKQKHWRKTEMTDAMKFMKSKYPTQ